MWTEWRGVIAEREAARVEREAARVEREQHARERAAGRERERERHATCQRAACQRAYLAACDVLHAGVKRDPTNFSTPAMRDPIRLFLATAPRSDA
jgi:hypothetical protein